LLNDTAIHAVLWHGNVATNLGTLGGTSSGAYAINDYGQVTGTANIVNDVAGHATLWQSNIAIDLGTLGGTTSSGFAINNFGQVAGYSQIAGDTAFHAALWNGTTAIDLGTLGGTYSNAVGIDNNGQIVGLSALDGNLTSHAVLWEGVTAIDLNSLLDSATINAGWELTAANDINDRGWIIGYAHNLLSNEYHAFLLTPSHSVPEPSSAFLLGLGLAIFSWSRGQQRRIHITSSPKGAG
jgi:probable HAF family extracellular repeat protein